MPRPKEMVVVVVEREQPVAGHVVAQDPEKSGAEVDAVDVPPREGARDGGDDDCGGGAQNTNPSYDFGCLCGDSITCR